MRVELNAGDIAELAVVLSSWRPEDVVRLISQVDVHMGDWDLFLQLKEWIDKEAALYAEEEAAHRRERGMCHKDPITGAAIHMDPHKGCVLR
jgi:hypothetical protein